MAMNARTMTGGASGGIEENLERLLLADAMKGPQTPNQLSRVNSDHTPVGKHILEDGQSALIIRKPESRNQDQFIGDVKVCVTGWQPLAILLDHTWHWQLDDPKRFLVLIA